MLIPTDQGVGGRGYARVCAGPKPKIFSFSRHPRAGHAPAFGCACVGGPPGLGPHPRDLQLRRPRRRSKLG
eukprot:5803663-Prymnesium_polylepis.3